jgi:hypothetical protein
LPNASVTRKAESGTVSLGHRYNGTSVAMAGDCSTGREKSSCCHRGPCSTKGKRYAAQPQPGAVSLAPSA